MARHGRPVARRARPGGGRAAPRRARVRDDRDAVAAVPARARVRPAGDGYVPDADGALAGVCPRAADEDRRPLQAAHGALPAGVRRPHRHRQDRRRPGHAGAAC
ncbi:MAG: hypothetical protein MZV65_01250 [Chromatiales bacterium]|nr:hypothetical protein [Chromatiales bacterium]